MKFLLPPTALLAVPQLHLILLLLLAFHSIRFVVSLLPHLIGLSHVFLAGGEGIRLFLTLGDHIQQRLEQLMNFLATLRRYFDISEILRFAELLSFSFGNFPG